MGRFSDGTVVNKRRPKPSRTRTKPLKYPPNTEIKNLSLSLRRDINQSPLTYTFRYFLVYGLEPYDSNITKNNYLCVMNLIYSFSSLGLSKDIINEKTIKQLNTLVEVNKDIFKLIATHNGFNINGSETCDIDALVDVDEELEEIRITVVISRPEAIKNKIDTLFKVYFDELNTRAPRPIQFEEFTEFAKMTLIKKGLINEDFKPTENFKLERVSNILSHINVCIVCGDLFYSRKASNICSNNTCKHKKTQYRITIENHLNKNNLCFPLGEKDKQELLNKLKMNVPDKKMLLDTLLGEIEKDINKLRDILKSDGWIIRKEGNTYHLTKRKGLKREIVFKTDGSFKIIEGREYFDRLVDIIGNYSTGKKPDDMDDIRNKIKLELTLKSMLK